MRLWMRKEERQITDEVMNAHGGIDAQRKRVFETLRPLPPDVRDRVNRLIHDVLMVHEKNPNYTPWDSPERVQALDEVRQLLGGFPHAYEAVMNYWPVAKSVRMTNWQPSA